MPEIFKSEVVFVCLLTGCFTLLSALIASMSQLILLKLEFRTRRRLQHESFLYEHRAAAFSDYFEALKQHQEFQNDASMRELVAAINKARLVADKELEAVLSDLSAFLAYENSKPEDYTNLIGEANLRMIDLVHASPEEQNKRGNYKTKS